MARPTQLLGSLVRPVSLAEAAVAIFPVPARLGAKATRRIEAIVIMVLSTTLPPRALLPLLRRSFSLLPCAGEGSAATRF
jgi:hypothetical protein